MTRAARKCAHKGCSTVLDPLNVSGMCGQHIHQDRCRCKVCTGGPQPKFRIRSRDELVSLGLLPVEPLFSPHMFAQERPKYPMENSQ